MIPYKEIAPLLATGKTPAQIAALLAPRTNRPIPIADLENFLDFNSVARRNAITSQWEGPLVDAMNNDGLPAELRGGISSLLTHFNKPRSVQVDTTQEPWASAAASLIGALVAIGLLSESQSGDVLALAGGYKYPGVNEAAVQAAVDRQTLQEQADATEAWYLARDAVVREGLHNLTVTTQQQVRDVFGGE